MGDILQRIAEGDGGIPAYDKFINTVLMMQLGRMCDLKNLVDARRLGEGVKALEKLAHLEMKFPTFTVDLEELLGTPANFNVLKSLTSLSLNFNGCIWVRDEGVGTMLGSLPRATADRLTSLVLNFNG